MTNKVPTPEQQENANNFLEASRELLFKTVEMIVDSRQELFKEGLTPEPDIEHFFLNTTVNAVSEKLTHYLHVDLITLAQAEVLKNLLNNYYDFLIKEYIEND